MALKNQQQRSQAEAALALKQRSKKGLEPRTKEMDQDMSRAEINEMVSRPKEVANKRIRTAKGRS